MAMETLWGLSGAALLSAVLLLTVTRVHRTAPLLRLSVAVMLMAVMFIPFIRGMSPAGYVFGYIGDLSVITVLLLLTSLLGTGRSGSDWQRLLFSMALVGGVVLYPFSLGPFPLDPYEWGYSPWLLLGAVVLVGFLIARRQPAATIVLALAVLAYGCNLSASTNLWDYLLDPLLFVYALWTLILSPVGKKIKKFCPCAF